MSVKVVKGLVAPEISVFTAEASFTFERGRVRILGPKNVKNVKNDFLKFLRLFEVKIVFYKWRPHLKS
jgi:hypothetical protein